MKALMYVNAKEASHTPLTEDIALMIMNVQIMNQHVEKMEDVWTLKDHSGWYRYHSPCLPYCCYIKFLLIEYCHLAMYHESAVWNYVLRCVCDPGFEVTLDKKNCLDIDECRDRVNILNSISGYLINLWIIFSIWVNIYFKPCRICVQEERV